LTALDGVTLDIAPGEFFGLLGPNGAGKSTFMSLISGLRPLDAGTLTVDGDGVSAGSARARQALGLVPQHIALYSDLSAERNLRIFGELYGLRGQRLSERVDVLLEAVQLADRRKDLVKEFSGGMQRRLNLAAALLHEPRLLLCDEPTVGVDPQSRNAIFDFLKELNRGGLTVIYSTHYMEEATRLCSRIGIIDHGKILASGTIDELLAKLPFEEEIRYPSTPETGALSGGGGGGGGGGGPAGGGGGGRGPGRGGGPPPPTLEGVTRFRPKPGYPLSSFYSVTERHDLPPRLFTSQRPTLEALFLQLTGRMLRE
jgi:ABC-2 type transport system ATP-binding protein